MTERLTRRRSTLARTTAAVLFASLALASTVASAAPEPASAPAAAANPDEPRFYMLSFTDQPVAEVAEQVLGVALGTPFVVDESVAGTMSFSVEEPLTEAQLLTRFAAALEANGVRVVRSPGSLRLTTALAPVVGVAVPPPTSPVLEGADAPSAFAGPPPRLAPPAVAAAPRADSIDRGYLLAGLTIGAGAVLLLFGLLWAFRTRVTTVTAAASAAREPAAPSDRQAALDRLLDAHAVPPDALAEACVEAARRREPVERALARTGAVSEEALAAAYAAVSGCGRWRAAERPPLDLAAAAPALAERLAQARLVPVEFGARLMAATDDPLEDGAVFALAGAAGRPVTLLVGTLSEVARALDEEPEAAAPPTETPQAAAEAGARLLSGLLERTAARRRRGGTEPARRRA